MERDGGVFLPEWQGWRNGAAKRMDEGGEGGEGGGEKRERERWPNERGEKKVWRKEKSDSEEERKMWSNEEKPFFLIDHIVCLFELPLHNRTHTHTHGDDYHTPYYGCTDNCLAPTGLPIHCNPSNTLNFHFKQKLNRQKTQGSILLPPLFFPPASCFVFFLSSLPSSRSNHLFNPFCICEIQYQNDRWCSG